MSVAISGLSADKKPVSLHHMPCHIERTGPANVKTFFDSAIRTDDDGGMTASFRGRPLNGTVVQVPDGYQGVVLKERSRPLSEEEERSFVMEGKFKEFTRWNLDQKPSMNDKLAKAMVWMRIAQAIHGSSEEISEKNGNH